MDGIPDSPGEIDPEELVEELRKIQSKDLPFPVRFHPDYPMEELASYYGDADGYRRTVPERCRFIWEITTIYPDGRVTPCMSFPAGLAGEQSLREIWNSPGYREFRTWCDRRGRLPACHRCCNT
jgi:MoaA/NifB/PqqE/SkfB family radical SAM enzyme